MTSDISTRKLVLYSRAYRGATWQIGTYVIPNGPNPSSVWEGFSGELNLVEHLTLSAVRFPEVFFTG